MSTNITELAVDPPLVMDSNYRMSQTDRRYIDDQILGLESHLVTSLLNGKHAAWFDLSTASASVAAGDTVCLASSSLSTTRGIVTKSTSAALSTAQTAAGVVLLAAAPGARVLVAISGVLPPTVTGLASGSSGFVRVNTTTGRAERVASIGNSDYGLGTVDNAGWLQIIPAIRSSTTLSTSATTLVVGNVEVQANTGGTANDHMLVQDSRTDHATRMHIEPHGHPSGTKSKLDLMLDPYNDDATNYRIQSMFTTDDLGTTGVNGVAVFNVKGVGDNFGVWPAMHIGFQDGASGSTPLKLYYFDTSDSAWRTPMKGMWRTGVAYTSGDYALANNKLYQAASTGTSGATKPSHTTGTSSDGTVSWTFIRDFSAHSGSIKPCIVIGERDDMPKFGFSTYRLQMSESGLLWNSVKWSFLDNTSVEAWSLYTKVSTGDLYIADATESKFVRFGGSSKVFQTSGLARTIGFKTDATGSATPDISAADGILFNNSGATSVTSFTGVVANQVFFVKSSNGNTTLVNGTSIKTNTGANKTLSSNTMLQFVMNSSGTVAIEVGTL